MSASQGKIQKRKGKGTDAKGTLRVRSHAVTIGSQMGGPRDTAAQISSSPSTGSLCYLWIYQALRVTAADQSSPRQGSSNLRMSSSQVPSLELGMTNGKSTERHTKNTRLPKVRRAKARDRNQKGSRKRRDSLVHYP